MIPQLLRSLLLVALAATAGFNQELKVDLNNHNRPVMEGNDPGFTSWNTNAPWFPGGDSISNTFNGITVKFTRVGDVGTALEPNFWRKTSLPEGWLDWTNLPGSGAIQLLPLNELTNQSPRYFRAFTQ